MASVYILTTPYNKDDLERLNCILFMMKWIEGTPDYGFTLGTTNTTTFKDNKDLLSLYMAAMTKYTLENPEVSKNQDSVSLYAMPTVLNYCNNPSNHLKMTKPMKKLWEAKEEGKLQEALK